MPARCTTGSEDLEGARRTESDALDAVPFIHRLMVRSWKRGEGGDSWEAEALLHARAFGLTSRAGDTPPRLESRPFGLVWRSAVTVSPAVPLPPARTCCTAFNAVGAPALSSSTLGRHRQHRARRTIAAHASQQRAWRLGAHCTAVLAAAAQQATLVVSLLPPLNSSVKMCRRSSARGCQGRLSARHARCDSHADAVWKHAWCERGRSYREVAYARAPG